MRDLGFSKKSTHRLGFIIVKFQRVIGRHLLEESIKAFMSDTRNFLVYFLEYINKMVDL